VPSRRSGCRGWREFPAILSSFSPAAGLDITAFRGYMVVAALGTVFAAGYLLWMYQRTAFGNVKSEFEHEHIHDVHAPEYLAWVPMLLLILGLGIVPSLIFRQTNGPVTDNIAAAFTTAATPAATSSAAP
jgi:NADH-quinone oxidoreductase subunit M